MTTETTAPRTMEAINGDIAAVESKAQAGGMTIDQLMALATEGKRLRTERDKVATEAEAGARDEIKAAFGALKFTVPKDAAVNVVMKRDGDKLIVGSVSIVSNGLADAVYAAIGDELLAKAEAVSSIKGVTVNGDGVSFNVPATRTPSTSSGGGNGAQKRAMKVDGVEYESAAAAYKAIFEVDKLPYAMNWDAVAGKIRNKDGKDSHRITE